MGLGALLNFLPSWHLEVLSFPALSAGCFDLGSPSNGRQRLRFGLFEADLASGELYKRGRLIRLQDQPFRILAMLLERPGEIVSREEVQKKLWREGTFVDFDEGLDTALRKLRQALGDSPQNSTFVETIPRRGYRFIAPVQGTENGSEADVTAEAVPAPSPVVPLAESTTAGKEHPVTRGIGSGWQLLAAGVLAIAVLAFITVRVAKRKPASPLELKQRQLTINSNENAVVSGAISPDGRFLAYSDPMGIHVKLIETGETQTLPRPDDLKGLQVSWAIVPTWVRDGTRLIANADVPGQPPSVWVLPVVGGPPRKVRDDAFAYTISRDGSWVVFGVNPGSVGSPELWMMRPDGTQARKLYDAGENNIFLGADWAPDGHRLGYVKASQTGIALESRDLEGGAPTIALPSGVADWEWSPDGRMIYSLLEPGLTGDSCNFWQLRIDTRTGKPLQGLKRLTNWAGFCMDSPSATADGKRLAFRKWSWLGSVYVAELEANGMHLTTPRRLTMDEGRNYPRAWTADSKAVVFGSDIDGHERIFKQFLDQQTSEPITTKADEDVAGGRVSPDGTWILYVALPIGNDIAAIAAMQAQLMRVPVRGGPPQFVLAAPIYGGPSCARFPSTLCAIAERTPDRKQLVFTAFDPLRGRGGELIRFETDAKAELGRDVLQYVWDLSPDGTRIAILKYSEGRIHILSLSGEARQEISVKDWNSLQSVNWAADGKGFFVSSATKTGSALLYVDLRGNAHILWEQKGNIAPWNGPFAQWLGGPSAPWAVPSPDGRHLAIYVWSLNANMWMMENF